MRRSLALALLLLPAIARAQGPNPGARTTLTKLHAEIAVGAEQVTPKVVAWREDIHQHPELGTQEIRTSKLVADHLRALGIEVRTGVGGHGVVGVLRGGKPGRVVALRADMDALPVTEQVDLPFKSTAKATYNGREVGVMHACGHDNHVAILMGAADVLAGMRSELQGTVVFLFQPAEEGPGGAKPMIEQGAMDDPKVDAVFGLHVVPDSLGHVGFRPGPMMASSDEFTIVVHGKQTHGAHPSGGVDPIVVGSEIVLAAQTIVSRQIDLAESMAVLTFGVFNAGVRNNIIPDSAYLNGTIRTLDPAIRQQVIQRLVKTATHVAEASGATAEVRVDSGYPVNVSDPTLTARMVPTLQWAAGAKNVHEMRVNLASEDFSYFAQRAPGMFVNLGVVPAGKDPAKAPSNHSPLFFADEHALPVGVRTMAGLAVDYLAGAGGSGGR
ncbi:MAG TPA: amidohydrolase [Gemmatimonadaceae bacterium]|nr:amidohydrolase [Gemmatimonadaceae bacterium]